MSVRRLDRSGKGQGVGHGAVAGNAPGEHGRPLDRQPRHERFDPFVHVAEPLLQAHDRLAAGREAKMAGFDDARMHRANRNLMQAFAFRRQKRVGLGRGRGVLHLPERVANRPLAVVQPRSRVHGTLGLQPRQVADRPLEPDCRCMQPPYRREPIALARKAQDCRIRCALRRPAQGARTASRPTARAACSVRPAAGRSHAPRSRGPRRRAATADAPRRCGRLR